MIPNYILVLGSPNTGKLRVANAISPSSELELDEKSHSGIIIKTSISNKYYSTNLNILIDEYPEKRQEVMDKEIRLQGLKDWLKEFVSEEYGELREVLDGIIFTVNLDDMDLDYIEKSFEYLFKLKESLNIEEEQWGGFLVIAGVTETNENFEDVEDLALDHGFEFLNMKNAGRNEYMERVGKDRLKEILETHEWRNMNMNDVNENYKKNKLNKAQEMTEELVPNQNGGSDNVDLESVLMKIHNVKEHANNLQGKKKQDFVNKAVEEIMDFL